MTDRKYTRYGDLENKLWSMREANYPDGVAVDPLPITAGEEITVLYYGLLAQSGADQVWLHCGFGPADRWYDINDYRMERTERGWVKKFKVKSGDRLNFCFRDSAYNWDNNNGRNWSFEIHEGNLP
ncbi:carbohydrate-binding protein [Calderihabitans maritimus]|uniref:Carbohydrate-binding family 25 protein n=1 Tax=Calderihabitans maritimus TaxID=1246530 RepID=A0A1Z5HQ00_9FIRM|nr:carbohydrate-binding protein [Calderihabitans maritimus]GAW91594.1 carbohydrate-binding family 25 protein [Calderihabitans maritimus]